MTVEVHESPRCPPICILFYSIPDKNLILGRLFNLFLCNITPVSFAPKFSVFKVWCSWGTHCSGMWHCVTGWLIPSVLTVHWSQFEGWKCLLCLWNVGTNFAVMGHHVPEKWIPLSVIPSITMIELCQLCDKKEPCYITYGGTHFVFSFQIRKIQVLRVLQEVQLQNILQWPP